MRIYAIGDIHGQLDALRAAHARIAKDRAVVGDAEAPVIHLGDYTDRGPDSRGVIDYLLAGRAVGHRWRFLKGNHDRMFRMFLDDPIAQDPVLRRQFTWLSDQLGGRDTLASYGFDDAFTAQPGQLFQQIDRIPAEHVAFLDGLETHISLDGLFFAHAGIQPGVPLDQQVEDDLIWIRGPFHRSGFDHGKLIVHGHTPVQEPMHYGNRINIDTGAGYGRPLTAAVFEGSDCWVLTDGGRAPLVPVDQR